MSFVIVWRCFSAEVGTFRATKKAWATGGTPSGTISKRKRAVGSVAHMARIRIKDGGVVVHSETKTSDREPVARQWIKNPEAELSKPGALAKLKAPDPTFAESIQKYVAESRKAIDRTTAQVLNTVVATTLARRRGLTITSADWVKFAKDLDVQPYTVGNYPI